MVWCSQKSFFTLAQEHVDAVHTCTPYVKDQKLSACFNPSESFEAAGPMQSLWSKKMSFNQAGPFRGCWSQLGTMIYLCYAWVCRSRDVHTTMRFINTFTLHRREFQQFLDIEVKICRQSLSCKFWSVLCSIYNSALASMLADLAYTLQHP